MCELVTKKSLHQIIDTKVKISSENNKTTNSSWLMYLSAFAADLLLISIGNCSVWPSSVIPKLTSNITEINPLGKPVTALQISIIVCSPILAASIGVMVMAKISDKLGRKTSLIYLSILNFSCFNIIAFGTHIYIYYLFLFIYGFAASGIYINIPIYISEIAEDKNRAWLGCCVGVCIPVGILISYITGSFASFKVITVSSTIPILIYLSLSFFTIESPIYLISRKRIPEAMYALEKLRTYKNFRDIEIEFSYLERSAVNKDSKKGKFLDLFKSRTTRRAIFIGFILSSTQQLSGIGMLTTYATPVFNGAGSDLSGNIISIIIGLVQLTMFVIAIFVVNKLGRRPLVLLSTLGCALSMFLVALYFYLKNIDSPIAKQLSWLPVLCVIIFIMMYSLGLGPIPIAFIGELFFVELRTTGVATLVISETVLLVILNFYLPLITAMYGVHICMFIYSLSSIIAFVILFLCLPETRGKSFIEIQGILKK